MDLLRNELEKCWERDSYKVLRNIVFKLAFWQTSNLSFLCSMAKFSAVSCILGYCFQQGVLELKSPETQKDNIKIIIML